ncbi:uncharacterized protein LOC124374434 [Homalodisca vitripennis]|uniref:uncharacterized protein LOC124374434 n=1 Tax=Homalodisca vitripennis TaxID=197043 RepID=UPI001EEA5017|nr:uncharacterized protein LOC124374434 [Homalodisca vitripennis]
MSIFLEYEDIPDDPDGITDVESNDDEPNFDNNFDDIFQRGIFLSVLPKETKKTTTKPDESQNMVDVPSTSKPDESQNMVDVPSTSKPDESQNMVVVPSNIKT